VPKGEKMLFTKIDSKGDSKGGEYLKRRIGKRRGSTKILSTQVGGASS
jgi:hypothetical protein